MMNDDDGRHVIFVDDEPNVRQIIGETLEQVGLNVSCFASAKECLEQLDSQECDLLITDLKMAEMDGIELLRRARLIIPWVPVLIVTGYGDIPTTVECIKAGAADFVEKPLNKKNFVEKVKSILQEKGDHFGARVRESLTPSEKRVLRLIIDSKSNKEIANLLSRSTRTIEVHRAHIMSKLGVDNLVDLVKRSMAVRLTELPEGEEPSDGVSDN